MIMLVRLRMLLAARTGGIVGANVENVGSAEGSALGSIVGKGVPPNSFKSSMTEELACTRTRLPFDSAVCLSVVVKTCLDPVTASIKAELTVL